MRIKGRILLVDDDILVRSANGEALGDAGFSCEEASTLGEAASLIRSNAFDLVVCDHDLPDGKGLSLVAKLENSPSSPRFVYLSAAGAGVLADASTRSNVAAVLAKPVDPDVLAEVVGAHLAEQSPDASHPRLIGEKERDEILDFGQW
jgi:two-component system response regulator PilR (NtrC family)